VALAAREIVIRELTLIDFSYPLLTLRVYCSKGTYIRSLTRDIGISLGVGGCVTALRRISTGGWPETMMLPLDAVMQQRESCVLPLKQWLRHLPEIQLQETKARRFLKGQRIQMDNKIQGEVTVFFKDLLLGTGMMVPGMHRMVLHPKKGLPSAQQRLLA